MILPPDKVLAGIAMEFGRIESLLPSGEGSARSAIVSALRLLLRREGRESTFASSHAAALLARFRSASLAVTNHPRLGPLVADIEGLLQPVGGSRLLRDGEDVLRLASIKIELFVQQLAAQKDVDAELRTRIGLDLSAWEIDDLRGQLGGESVGTEHEGNSVNAISLAGYLQDRFDDPSLEVPTCAALPGGFGKQTFLFSAQGKSLSGEFVMRRDPAVALLDNDCHRCALEHRLLRALYERGFPTPEALWLDTRHRLLPGGDFIIMKRAAGVPGGSVFAADGEMPAALSKMLAGILARLHALAPMKELFDLSESINAERWSAPLETCVRQYIEGYHSLLKREAHLPSPALASLFTWLRDNVPTLPGTPVLLHGDIGFHNFLFHEGEITVTLDWEHAHLGDPAEDLAYVRNTVGHSINWDAFLADYRAAGGIDVSVERIHFFQVWGQTRNICASNLAAAKFANGSVRDLKMVMLPHIYIPQFLEAARALIEQGPSV